MTHDPYEVLGLPNGASAAEVKRAYRRLAKVHHPDSAGEAALPQFLEIQRAYEQLTSTTAWRPGRRRQGSAEPWRADPARARSTPGAAPPPGARSETAGRARTGATAGGARPGANPKAGARPKEDADRPSDGPPPRRRASRKATFGSTTYDEARDPADPTWSGAAWYGPTSGEYWQVNPREYADPRKHGPEYLARAAERAARAERAAAAASPVGGAAQPVARDRMEPEAQAAPPNRWSAALPPPLRRLVGALLAWLHP